MKRNVAIASFHCLVGKIWKKIVFYVVIGRGKDGLVCVVPEAQKPDITFLWLVIKYS